MKLPIKETMASGPAYAGVAGRFRTDGFGDVLIVAASIEALRGAAAEVGMPSLDDSATGNVLVFPDRSKTGVPSV